MADQTKIDTTSNVTADAPVAATSAPAKPAAATVATTAPVAKRAAAKAAAKTPRARKVRNVAPRVVAAVKIKNKRAVKQIRRVAKAAPTATAAPLERTFPMTYDFNSLFAGFQIPGADRFQDVLSGATERSQQLVGKSQKVAGEATDIAKANVEAIVEAGRIAVSGARAIGQDVLASGRDSIEQASDAVKTLAEAKSPTEFFQIQSELARASFDRFVAESSKLTERVVKLAGEAAQPLQNRASINAERINDLVA